MVPVDSRRVPRVPRYLGATRSQDGIFIYGAVTLYGRTFQTVLLTPSHTSFAQKREVRSQEPESRSGLLRPSILTADFRLPASEFVVLQPQALLANHLV